MDIIYFIFWARGNEYIVSTMICVCGFFWSAVTFRYNTNSSIYYFSIFYGRKTDLVWYFEGLKITVFRSANKKKEKQRFLLKIRFQQKWFCILMYLKNNCVEYGYCYFKYLPNVFKQGIMYNLKNILTFFNRYL